MKKIEFNGEWEIKLDLEKFIDSNNKWNENQKPNKNPINLKIQDQKNYEPDPLDEQLNAIEFLINNQVEVLENLCRAFDVINEKYGESSGEHDWYPKHLTIDNLGLIFFISEIEILVEHKDNHAYVQFSGGYKGDYEHGLIVVTHLDRLIGFDQIGEDVYEEIYSDLGDEGNKFRNFNIENQEFGNNQVHQPLPKYGKYKPWQLDATEEHFGNLIRTRKNEEFINEFEKSNLDINFRFPFLDRSLVETAVIYKNTQIIAYLIQNGADASKSLVNCTYRNSFNQDTIKCLIENGISIDTISYQGLTPLGNEIKNFIWYIGSLVHYKDGDSRIESAYKEMEISKEKMRFYVAIGANPNHIDINGNDYKSILSNHHKQEQLKKHKAYIVLEKVLFPNKPQSKKWKFWKN